MKLPNGINILYEELLHLDRVIVGFTVVIKEFCKSLNDPKLVREIQRETNRNKYYRRFKI